MKLFLAVVLMIGLAASGFCAESPIYPALKGNLVALNHKYLKRFDPTPLASAKYYAIYYSASWCGPCRKFTPELVAWYNAHKKQNPHFELIFVSHDNSEQEMAGYMTEDAMPWPALDFKRIQYNKALTQYAGPGIPCLVFVDDQGHVLSDSYQGKTYLGPQHVLAEIEKTLAANPPSAEALAAAAKPSASKPGGSNFDEMFKKTPAKQ